MADAPDLFIDDYHFAIHPFGVAIEMRCTVPQRAGEMHQAPKNVVTIRMAHPTLKVMIYQLVRRMAAHEKDNGEVPVNTALLNQCGIGPEDWAEFWARARGTELKP